MGLSHDLGVLPFQVWLDTGAGLAVREFAGAAGGGVTSFIIGICGVDPVPVNSRSPGDVNRAAFVRIARVVRRTTCGPAVGCTTCVTQPTGIRSKQRVRR